MKLEEIIEIITQEINNISIEYQKDPRYEICDNYRNNKKNDISNIEDLLEIDFWEFIRCLIYINKNENTTLSDCESVAKNIKTFFEELNLEKTESLINDIWSAATESIETYEKVINYKDDEIWKTLSEIVKFTRENKELAEIIFYFLETRRELELKKKEILLLVNSLKKHGINEKKALSIAKRTYNKDYNFSYIFEKYKSINNFAREEEKKEEKHKKSISKIIVKYKKAISLLEQEKEQKEIKKAKEIIDNISNEEIKKIVLIWISNHNQNYYDELTQKLNKIKEDSKNGYLEILAKHNLQKYVKYVTTLQHNKPQEVDEIISMLKKSEYSEEEIIIILQRTIKSKFDKINEYINLKYITLEKVKENQLIYYQEDNKLEKMQKNIKEIEKLEINPKIFKSNPECLWQETELFLKNLSLLKDYNMINMIKNCKNFKFLLEDHLEEKLDLFIELDYLEYLQENIELLNCSNTRLKRLELLKQMNIPIEDLDTLEDILKNTSFFVKDEELDNHIMDYASYNVYDPHYLDGLDIRTNEISISINGSTFSVPKIRRKQAENKTLLESMFYNKRVTEEEYKKIIEKLTNQFTHKI